MHFVIIIITTGFYSQHEHNNYVTEIITSLTVVPELRGELQLPELHARYATGERTTSACNFSTHDIELLTGSGYANSSIYSGRVHNVQHTRLNDISGLWSVDDIIGDQFGGALHGPAKEFTQAYNSNIIPTDEV